MKPIPKYAGYFASRKGIVYRKLNGVLIEPSITTTTKKKYHQICIRIGPNNWTHDFIHRLVAMVFIPNPNNYPCVLHLDNDTSNNHYKNLAWGTHKMNSEQMINEGRHLVIKRKTKITNKMRHKVFRLKAKGLSPYKIKKYLPLSVRSIYTILKD